MTCSLASTVASLGHHCTGASPGRRDPARRAAGRSTGSSGSTRASGWRSRATSRSRFPSPGTVAGRTRSMPRSRRGDAPGLDRVVLGRQAEGVVAHRVDHLKAVAAAEMGDRVADRVVLQVPDVRLPRRVGEHLEHVGLGAVRLEPGLAGVGHLPGALLGPDPLPLGLDRTCVVSLHVAILRTPGGPPAGRVDEIVSMGDEIVHSTRVWEKPASRRPGRGRPRGPRLGRRRRRRRRGDRCSGSTPRGASWPRPRSAGRGG